MVAGRRFLLDCLGRFLQLVKVLAFIAKLALVLLEELAEGLRLGVWLHFCNYYKESNKYSFVF